LHEAVRMCERGEIADGKTIAGIMLAALQVGTLVSAGDRQVKNEK
jgi:hypothetical protein